MVGDVEREEGPGGAGAGREHGGRRAQDRAGDLVLEALVRQVERRVDAALVAVGGAEELHRVGGEAGGVVEAGVGDPRVSGALGEVLAAHHHRAAGGVGLDVVVDVLRGIGLVAHDEAAGAEAEVLDQGGVAGERFGAGVGDLDAPQPERALGVEPQGDGMAERRGRALPDDAVVEGGEGGGGPRPDGLEGGRVGAGAQDQPPDAGAEGRAVDLVDQRAAGGVLVLDGEEAAVGQDADRQAGGVGDADEAEVGFPRGLEGQGHRRVSRSARLSFGDSGTCPRGECKSANASREPIRR